MEFTPEEHERGLGAFILPQRRERFAAALEKGGKARRKELARLHDRPDFDPRWTTPLPIPDRGETSGAVVAALNDLVPSAAGHVVSGDPELDGRFLEVAEALEIAAWTDQGVLISVVPGRVAVYAGELVDSVRLLSRDPSDT